MKSYNSHHNHYIEYFHGSKKLFCAPIPSHHSNSALTFGSDNHFLVQNFVNGIIQYRISCVWSISVKQCLWENTSLLNWIDTFIKYQLTIYVWVYSFSWTYSILAPMPNSLDDYHFRINLRICSLSSLTLFLFKKLFYKV